MTPHIHTSASTKSSLFKRLVIVTIVVSIVIYLAFTFSLFKVPTKFQSSQSASTTNTKENGNQQVVVAPPKEGEKPTGIIVQTPPAPALKKDEKVAAATKLNEEHEDLGTLESPPTPVEELDGKTFDDFIKSSPNALVYVFSPTCPHCIQFSPTFDALVEKLNTVYGGKIHIGKVVGPKNIDTLVVPLGVKGYPTLMFFTKGNLKSKTFYDGARKIPDILTFIEKQLKQ